MTKEEKQKAIDALKVSVPFFAITQEAFIDYRQTLNKVTDWLEQEPILDKIREQFKSHLRGVEITLEVLGENDPLRPKFEGAKETLEECLEIIDKAESEKK